MKQPEAPRQPDEDFEPWEEGRPIPLFLIAVVFALGLWGLLTYLSGWAETATPSARSVPTSAAKPLSATGLSNLDEATQRVVAVGQGQAWSCASCHGAAGQGSLNTPRLAGQPAAYLEKQLRDFATGAREHESMAVVAKGLTPVQMQKLADYYSQIVLHDGPVQLTGADLARGKLLAEQGDWKSNVPACFSCHGKQGEGVAPGFPALAGQSAHYLFGQLSAWRAGERKNSPQQLMDGIAQRMRLEDMRAVSDYLASLPGPGSLTREPPAAPSTAAALAVNARPES